MSLANELSKVLEEEPAAPMSINGEVPRSLNDLVLRTMSKDRDARPKTAAELHDLLTQVEQSADKRTPVAATVVTARA